MENFEKIEETIEGLLPSISDKKIRSYCNILIITLFLSIIPLITYFIL